MEEYQQWHERAMAKQQRSARRQLDASQAELTARDQRITQLEAEVKKLQEAQNPINASSASLTTSLSPLHSSTLSLTPFSPSPFPSNSLTPTRTPTCAEVTVVSSSCSTTGVPFPRALTAQDARPVADHVANLFAQVGALKSRLASMRNSMGNVAAFRTPKRPMIGRGSGGEEVGASANSGSVQQSRSETRSVARIEVEDGPDSPPVLSLSTTTRSLVSTSSNSSLRPREDAPAALLPSATASGSAGNGDSFSEQVSTLASRSDSFESFVAEMSAHVGEYHETTHQLRAEVEHWQKQDALRVAEAASLAERAAQEKRAMSEEIAQLEEKLEEGKRSMGEEIARLEEKLEEEQRRMGGEITRLEQELEGKDAQLCEVQELLRLYLSQMRTVQREFCLSNGGVEHQQQQQDGPDVPLHFFSTLHSYLSEMSRQHRSLRQELEAAQDSQAKAQAQGMLHEDKGMLWGEERARRMKLEEQVNMLQLVLDTERVQHSEQRSSSGVTLPNVHAPVVSQRPVSASRFTVLASQSRPSHNVVIPHLPLHKLIPADTRSSAPPAAVAYPSYVSSSDDDEYASATASEHEEQEEKTQCVPTRDAIAGRRVAIAGTRGAASYYLPRSPQVKNARVVRTGSAAPHSTAAASTAASTAASHSAVRHAWSHAVDRASDASGSACADGSAFGVPSPLSSFQLLMRTPFATGGTSVAGSSTAASAAPASASSATGAPRPPTTPKSHDHPARPHTQHNSLTDNHTFLHPHAAASIAPLRSSHSAIATPLKRSASTGRLSATHTSSWLPPILTAMG